MFKKSIMSLGCFLYRYRGIIAVPFFIILVIFSRPSSPRIAPYIFLATGIVLRVWAAGYIGPASRQNTFAGDYVITNGPYRYVKHPLYLGNFFLVLGVMSLFNPPAWLAIILIGLFIVEYTLIVRAEQNYLTNLPRRNAQFHFGNLKNEISTVLVIIAIYIVYVINLKV